MSYATFLDGADHYGTADILKRWSSKTGTVTINATGGRRNKGYIALTPAIGTKLTRVISTSEYVTAGFPVKLSEGDLSSGKHNILLHFSNADVPQLFLAILPDSKLLQVYRHAPNGTYPDRNAPVLLGTSSTPLTMDSWQYIELGAKINNSGSVELRINGSSAAGFAEILADTYYTGACNVFGLGAPTAQPYGDIYYGLGNFDDIRCSYGTQLVWKGDRRIDYLALTANDTQQDWTVSSGNAWEALNGNGENIQSSTLNAISRFAVADLEHAPLSIDTIQLIAKAQKSDSGDRAVALLAKSGSDEVTGTSQYLSETSAFITEEVVEDPATSSAWTESGINNLIIGVKVAV